MGGIRTRTGISAVDYRIHRYYRGPVGGSEQFTRKRCEAVEVCGGLRYTAAAWDVDVRKSILRGRSRLGANVFQK